MKKLLNLQQKEIKRLKNEDKAMMVAVNLIKGDTSH